MQTVSKLQSKPSANSRNIQNQNQNQGYVPLLRSGAAAPSRSEQQATVVASYVVAATEARVPIEGRARAMIAGQAGQLLDEGWPLEAILRAVDRFARRRRFAGHLAQWCRENAADERTSEHEARMRDDRRTADTSMRSLLRIISDGGR